MKPGDDSLEHQAHACDARDLRVDVRPNHAKRGVCTGAQEASPGLAKRCWVTNRCDACLKSIALTNRIVAHQVRQAPRVVSMAGVVAFTQYLLNLLHAGKFLH